jgi:hypothetical protein
MKQFLKNNSGTILSLFVTGLCTFFVLKVNAMIDDKAVTKAQFNLYADAQQTLLSEVIKRQDNNHQHDEEMIAGLRQDIQGLRQELRALTIEMSRRPPPPRYSDPDSKPQLPR